MCPGETPGGGGGGLGPVRQQQELEDSGQLGLRKFPKVILTGGKTAGLGDCYGFWWYDAMIRHGYGTFRVSGMLVSRWSHNAASWVVAVPVSFLSRCTGSSNSIINSTCHINMTLHHRHHHHHHHEDEDDDDDDDDNNEAHHHRDHSQHHHHHHHHRHHHHHHHHHHDYRHLTYDHLHQNGRHLHRHFSSAS